MDETTKLTLHIMNYGLLCEKKPHFYCSLSIQPLFNFKYYLLFDEIRIATSKSTLNLIDNPLDDSPSTHNMVVDQGNLLPHGLSFSID
jgi:hypothetical protein